MYRVGLIGAGKAGRKRAEAATAAADTRLAAVCDLNVEAAAALAEPSGARITPMWREIVDDESLDVVVVATSHDFLSTVTVASLMSGKHVLCEKPVGRNPAEVAEVVQAARVSGCRFHAGYNHRFHPAVCRVFEACRGGVIGPLIGIRGCYGHGGRPGYETEWRARAEISGGGEMLDQGVHILDLALALMGDFVGVRGLVMTQYWDIAPIEDNAYGLFRTAQGQVLSLHASWTEWKNIFAFEVFGREGYALARGLGGSYGPEEAIVGRRRNEGGTPDEERWQFSGPDNSWEQEWTEFTGAIASGGNPQANAEEALRVVEWVSRLYRASVEGREVGVDEDPTSWDGNA